MKRVAGLIALYGEGYAASWPESRSNLYVVDCIRCTVSPLSIGDGFFLHHGRIYSSFAGGSNCGVFDPHHTRTPGYYIELVNMLASRSALSPKRAQGIGKLQ